MKPNYRLHVDMYAQTRQAGWEGCGGNERMSKATLVERFLELDGRPKQGKLLELGCGEGYHCRAFSQLGFEVTGVDILPTAISWAEEKAEATGIAGKYYVADLTADLIELPDQYDVVIDGNCLQGAFKAPFLLAWCLSKNEALAHAPNVRTDRYPPHTDWRDLAAPPAHSRPD